MLFLDERINFWALMGQNPSFASTACVPGAENHTLGKIVKTLQGERFRKACAQSKGVCIKDCLD